jgi:hypothetical protein
LFRGSNGSAQPSGALHHFSFFISKNIFISFFGGGRFAWFASRGTDNRASAIRTALYRCSASKVAISQGKSLLVACAFAWTISIAPALARRRPQPRHRISRNRLCSKKERDTARSQEKERDKKAALSAVRPKRRKQKRPKRKAYIYAQPGDDDDQT